MGIDKIIAESSKSLLPAQAILLYLTTVLEEERAPELLKFLPEADYQTLSPYLEQFMTISVYERRFPLLDEVQRLSRENIYRGLDEIDGSWILHFLRREKPAVIGLILKHLPADKVYQILSRMDPELRSNLPDSRSLDQVSEEIIQVVRKRFEEQLVGFKPPRESVVLDFQCIRNLAGKETFTLVRDLGFDLLAIAFQGVNERSLIELVKNLDEEDAEGLFEKFKLHRNVNRGETKAAQLEILNLSLDFSGGADLIVEAGVQQLARAIINEEEDFITALQYKLPLKSGYQLRRYVDDFRTGKPPEGVLKKFQGFILKRIVDLSKAGTIDKSWSNLRRSQEAVC